MEVLDVDFSILDFSRSLFAECDLKKLPIERANLSKAELRECNLPEQRGKSTWYGWYKPSVGLLQWPVDEVFGIDSVQRGIIAEEQQLARLVSSTQKNLMRKLSFCVWGVATDYGRSLSRFGLFCILIILGFTFLEMQACMKISWIENPELAKKIWSTFKAKAEVFLGFSNSTDIDMNTCSANTNFALRLLGFVCLGLWIGVAANRLGFLTVAR